MNDFHTRVCIASLKSRLEDTSPQWQRVLSDAAARRATHLHESALLVMVAATDAAGRRTLKSYLSTTAHAPTALIVGDHPACDVSGVFGASLRHVALWIDPALTPGWVHAVDLNTPTGMLVDGEQGIRRVDARCSVRIGAGSADLLAMALVPGENVDVAMLHAFSAPFIPRARSEGFVAAPAPRARQPRSHSETQVTRLGAIRCELTRGGAATGDLRVTPTAEDLERGFILGRYERCSEQLNDTMVSRVHALLVAHRDGVLVIDTGSTHGTDVLRRDVTLALGIIRRAAVVPRGFRVNLGGTVVEVR